MDIAELRAAFKLLEFDEIIKDVGRVKTRYRALVLKYNSDHAQDPKEKILRDEKMRALVQAKSLCLDFCSSPLSIEEAEKAAEDSAHAEYLKMLNLFIGRILQYKFMYWARVPLPSEKATPEFDQTVEKFPLVKTFEKVFKLLAAEHGRANISWVLSFEVSAEENLAWVVMELVDGTHLAQVFFTEAPGRTHVLPEITHTLRTFEGLGEILRQQGLHKVRGVRGSEFWGEYPDDPWQIQVTGGGAALCWMTTLEGNLTPIGFYRANSVEELQVVLSRWIGRVKAESWAGPL